MNSSPPNPAIRAINTLANRRVHNLAERPQDLATLGIVASPLFILFCLLQAAGVSAAYHNAPLLLHAFLFSTAMVATVNLILATDFIRSKHLRPPSYLLAALPTLSIAGAGAFFMVTQPNEANYLNEKMTDVIAYFSIAAAAWYGGLTIPFIPLARRRQRASILLRKEQ